jgi:multiple sugar transport system ATP-binding protein
VHVIFTVDTPPVVTEQTMAAGEPDEGEFVPLVEAEGKTSFTARVDPRTKCRPGSTVRLTVDPGRFHFFERDSGKAIGAPSALATSAS